MTPSLARMVLSLCRENSGAGKVDIAALLPIKWFSIPQCWRFETTQRGRKREHYQWNMDIVGMPTVNCEAELLAAMVHFFESVGITSKDVGIKVNSRKVLGCVLEDSGVPKEQFEKVQLPTLGEKLSLAHEVFGQSGHVQKFLRPGQILLRLLLNL